MCFLVMPTCLKSTCAGRIGHEATAPTSGDIRKKNDMEANVCLASSHEIAATLCARVGSRTNTVDT